MRKAFLFVVAVILIAVYMDYINASAPVALEKKLLTENRAEAVADTSLVITVMTYNIHRGVNKNGKLDLDGIVAVIKDSGAEIIALQEVERFSIRTGFRDQIKYIADKLSMQYAFGKSLNILNGEYGNGILSKYPIEEYEVNELPSEGEQRTLLRAGLNINGRRISIYNTHLGLRQSERNGQIEEIVKLVEADKNFLIAGDFNTKADKLGPLTESYIDCASFGDNYNRVTFEEDGLKERIDYIFASKGFEIKAYDVPASDASDHYPVISILKFID